jgi:chemotaxis protein MotB
MAKRGHGGGAEEHAGGMERWLLTYADMITLLLIFFIILYSMSVINKVRFDQMIQMMNKTFGGGYSVINTGSPGVLAQNKYPNPKNQKLKKAYVHTVSKFQGEISSKKIRVSVDDRGVVISLASDFYFPSGSPDLSAQAADVLLKIHEMLDTMPNNVRIEGHTDNVPITAGSALAQRYPTNWELSAQRAINVLKFYEGKGIKSKRLSALGYADTRPLKPNDSEENRAFNRRVEIIILGNPNTEADAPPMVDEQ